MAQSRRFKDLFKNIGLLTLGNFATKLLSFFLVPLYTSVLTTAEYGIYDIIHTTIVLLVPVLTINIQESVLRFTLSKDEDESGILKTGIRFVNLSLVIVLCLSLINYKVHLFETINTYGVYFVLLFFFTALNQVLSSFARGIDKVKDYTIASVISSAVTICLNVWLLAFAGKGLTGYFMAFILGSVASCIYLTLKLKVYRYLGKEPVEKELRRSMVAYSAPLVLNAIGWWVNSASDRYVVTWLCGLAVNGIYSVGYKIPSIINVFQTIFNQAWLLSAVKEFDPQDKDGFFVKTYNIYGAAILFICFGLNVFTRFIALILYKGDFYSAWIYVPLLNISILFGALSGVIGGVFSAVKDSKIFSVSTLIGAAVNVILDIALVYKYSAIGAAIATMVSYVVVWLIRLVCAKKYIVLRLNLKRDIIAYFVLMIQILWLYIKEESILYYLISFVLLAALLFLYQNEMRMIIMKARSSKNEH